MTINHHPGDEILLAYAAGTLATAPRLVVAAHLEVCAACRRRAGLFEAVGGKLLEDGPSQALGSEALAKAMAALDLPAKPQTSGRRLPLSEVSLGIDLPLALQGQRVGGWRWVAPGIRISKIDGLWNGPARGFLLKASPGVTVPHHDHDGIELAQILAGALIDEDRRFGPGDCAQAEPGLRHQPQSDPREGCICLIAIDGRTRPSHWMGRLIQHFIDI